MATVGQLKEEIAKADADIAKLTPAYESAKSAASDAQSKLDAYYAKPDKLSFNQYTKAKNAAEANPNDPAAQQAAKDAQEKWNAQQSELQPLLKARDETAIAAAEAKAPIIEADDRAAKADKAIARIDPAQASQDARDALAAESKPPGPQAPVSNSATDEQTSGNTSKPGIQAFEDGTTLKINEDGSTEATDLDGNVTTTEAANPNQALVNANNNLESAKTGLVAAQQNSADAQEALANATNARQEAQDRLSQLNADPEADPNDIIAAQLDLSEAENAEAEAQDAANAAAVDVDDAQLAVDDAQTVYDNTDIALPDEITYNDDPVDQDALFATEPDYTGNPNSGTEDTGMSTEDQTNMMGDVGGGAPRDGSRINSSILSSSGGAAAQAKWTGASDLRVKLMVPPEYIQDKITAGPVNAIQKNGGILFPYTPTISYNNSAEYSKVSPLHSNFSQYFFKNASVGPISITGKFTVQTEFEGAMLLGILHLLRSLTKMRWGDEKGAGSPPPVCRLDAYGDYMLHNVPVTVAGWKHDLPDGVDYIGVGRKYPSLGAADKSTYGHTLVPVMSTIQIDLNVMYSRQEMQKYNVTDWLKGSLRYKGYL